MNLFEQIKLKSKIMRGKQAAVGKFIANNLNNVWIANMKLSSIASEAGVSEATVTRFVYALGYKNFADFQLALQKHMEERFHSRTFQIEQGNLNSNTVYSKVFSVECQLMEETLNRIDPDVFEKFVDLIRDAKKLFLVGCCPNEYLINYFHIFLEIYRDDVVPITSLNLISQSIIATSDKNDYAAVVFSYPRYPVDTQRIVEQLHAKGIRIAGLTDSEFSPIAPFCDLLILTPHKYFIITDPMASVMALIHAFIFAFYKRDVQEGKRRMRRYETITRELHMFMESEFNFADEIKE